ncbi:MAG TPA: F0F1 ATP synthase subunit B [Sutterella sp.]|nr:F0F1 ATP synthase subunit B [Sutterella sp.]
MNINASLFVQLLVLFIGAIVTMKYIWPPLIRAIDERRKKIGEGLAAADKGAQALEAAQKEGQSIKDEARAQGMTIVTDSEKRAQAIIEEAKAQAQIEADRIIESAKAEILQEAQKAREALRNDVARLAVEGAEKILLREVNAEVHARMLEDLKARL